MVTTISTRWGIVYPIKTPWGWCYYINKNPALCDCFPPSLISHLTEHRFLPPRWLSAVPRRKRGNRSRHQGMNVLQGSLSHSIHGTGQLSYIYTYIHHKDQPNVVKYTIHGWYGHITNPNNARLTANPSNYHTFALFDPKKIGSHLMIPVLHSLKTNSSASARVAPSQPSTFRGVWLLVSGRVRSRDN